MKTMKLCPYSAGRRGSGTSARLSATAAFFSIFRSLPLVALVVTRILSAAAPQPFRQPLVFEPNRGQAEPQSTWTAHGPGYEFQLTGDAAVMTFREHASGVSRILKMKLAGSASWSHVAGLEPTGGVSNYINRPNGAASITAVPHYLRAKVSNVYPGIDLIFYSNAGNVEYDFVVAPGSDPGKIELSFEGHDDLHVDGKSGDLVIRSGSSELRHFRPRIYQQVGSERIEVAGGYQLPHHDRVTFAVAGYDRQRPLIIDPTVAFIQFLNGEAYEDGATAIATDTNGNSYVTGYTRSTRFPVQDALQPSFHECESGFGGFCASGPDAFVTKLSADGTILFSTYLGGNNGDGGRGIAVDATGVYIAGWTYSGDFPNKIPNSISDTRFGKRDTFVTKLSPDGAQLIYSRIISGSGDSTANSIAVDSQHSVWVTGHINSGKFVVGATGHQYYSQVNGPGDIFYAKYGPAGEDVLRGLVGGSGDDSGYGIAVDLDDNPWFTGQTCSPDFPATPGFGSLRGRCGVFVLRFTNQPRLGTTKFAAVFGGSDGNDAGTGSDASDTAGDLGAGIVVDANREAYVTGHTSSALFPVRTGGYQTVPVWSGPEAFVTKLDGRGDFLYSTLLGSYGDTFASSIALNAAGEVYIGGNTSSTTFPGLGPLIPNPTTGFLAKFSSDLSTLLYTTEQGTAVNGVALSETLAAVTPSQIYTAGFQNINSDGTAFVDKVNDDIQYTRLRNYWRGDQYINIESGAAKSSQISPGWLSAQWEFDLQPTTNGDPVGAKVFWIRNRWKANQYLNIESGSLQSTQIGPGWLSARWVLEPINGRNVYRIRNVWQPDKCLNIESGALRASPIEPGWWSAWWVFDRVF